MRGADYVIKRSIFALVTVWVAVTLNFILFRLLPGNSVSGLRCQACTPQFKEALIKEYGLDKSKWQQYVTYLGNLLHGDLGYSQYNNIPVWDGHQGANPEHAADGAHRDADLGRARRLLRHPGRLAAGHADGRQDEHLDGARLLRRAHAVAGHAGHLLRGRQPGPAGRRHPLA